LRLGYPSVGLFSSEGGQFMGGHAMSDDAKTRSAAALNALWDDGKLERIRASEEAAILPGRRLSVFLQAQPDVAQVFLQDPVLRDIGLLARFLVTQPDTMMGSRKFRDLALGHKLSVGTYGAKMLALLRRNLPYEDDGKGNAGDALDPPALVMTGKTRAEWIRFSDHVEQMLGPCRELSEISGFANKLAEHAARIAGVLQVFDDPDVEELSLDHLVAGIKIAEFFASETLRLHSASRVGLEIRDAEILRRWLMNHWQEPYITVRVIQRVGPGSMREKSRIERLLNVLEAHNWVARMPGATVEGKQTRTAWAISGKA
jgi:hypothetical protein